MATVAPDESRTSRTDPDTKNDTRSLTVILCRSNELRDSFQVTFRNRDQAEDVLQAIRWRLRHIQSNSPIQAWGCRRLVVSTAKLAKTSVTPQTAKPGIVMVDLQTISYNKVISKGLHKPSRIGSVTAAKLLGDFDALYVEEKERRGYLISGAFAFIRVALVVTSVLASVNVI